MGVYKGESEGAHPLLVECVCGQEYVIDETTTNECPECGVQDYRTLTGNPSDWQADEQ